MFETQTSRQKKSKIAGDASAAVKLRGDQAILLVAASEGDANMRAVWLCSRNDALGNIAVMAAAGGVALTGQAWPDLLVAVGMASLALHSSRLVLRQAADELKRGSAAAS